MSTQYLGRNGRGYPRTRGESVQSRPMSYYALVPAAGSGARMGGERPKQYLPLLGQPLIRHTVAALCGVVALEAVFVVLSPDDEEWQQYDWSAFGDRLQPLFCGGASRAESVTNGLRAMAECAFPDDWVLVHDAARACLTAAQVERLIAEASADPVGGILAVPVADTLKRATRETRIETTVSREGLWQAQTPQMFRHGLLLEALSRCPQVTDEASAVEFLGHAPRLVLSDATNLKVTFPLDLTLAELILTQRKANP